MKVLFVCTGNRSRSVTAHALLEQRGGHEVRSAGTHAESIAGGGTQLTAELIDWADRIYVFESMHVRFIRYQFGTTLGMKAKRKTFDLDIPDQYPAFDPELIEILDGHLDRLFGNKGSRNDAR